MSTSSSTATALSFVQVLKPLTEELRQHFDAVYKTASETYPLRKLHDLQRLDQFTPAALRALKKDYEDWLLTNIEQIRAVQASPAAQDFARLNKVAEKSGLSIQIVRKEEGYSLNSALRDKTGLNFLNSVSSPILLQFEDSGEKHDIALDTFGLMAKALASSLKKEFNSAALNNLSDLARNVVKTQKSFAKIGKSLFSEKILTALPKKDRASSLQNIQDGFNNIEWFFIKQHFNLALSEFAEQLKQLQSQIMPLGEGLSTTSKKLLKALLDDRRSDGFDFESDDLQWDGGSVLLTRLTDELKTRHDIIKAFHEQDWAKVKQHARFLYGDDSDIFEKWKKEVANTSPPPAPKTKRP